MLKLYHAPKTRSIRIFWLLEELGLPYKLKHLAFDPKELQAPEYLAIHPLGQVPALEDDGLVLTESGAIAQYILSRYGKGRLEPEHNTAEYGRYLTWFHMAEATAMPYSVMLLQHKYRLPEEQRVPALVDYANKKLGVIFGLIDRQVAQQPFLCGKQFTAADIMFGYNIYLATQLRVSLADYPNLTAYYERLRARPGFTAAIAKPAS